MSSQIEYIIAVKNQNENVAMIDFTRRKCRRITRSFLASEVMAFTAVFEAALIVNHDLSQIVHRRLSLFLMTDSRGLFDMISRISHSSEKRLMIDIAALRGAYRRKEIDSIAHIQGKSNPSNALIKITHSDALNCLMNGITAVQVTQ